MFFRFSDKGKMELIKWTLANLDYAIELSALMKESGVKIT
jgi:hypothetical protein